MTIRIGATGEIKGNLIQNHSYTNAGDAFSAGIAAFDDNANTTNRTPRAFIPLLPIRYEGNTFSNNDEHLVIIAGNESQVINNTFHGTGPSSPRWGALAVSGTNIVVANNNFSGIPTGIVLFGNDIFFSNWPAIPPATNPRLEDNWFCNVPEPLSIHVGATGVQEQGTQSCPFRPILQCTGRDAAPPASVSLAVRSWHAQSVVIESSTDLQNWSPLYTNTVSLPSLEYRDAIASGDARRFYRAVQQ